MKYFILPLTEPLGFIWLLMALGFAWLFWRRQWRSAMWLGVPTLLIVLIGSTPLVDGLVSSDERPWTGEANGQTVRGAPSGDGVLQADVVVALGSGQSPSLYEPLKFSMGDAAGSRVLSAVELVRQGKAATLVLGGSGPMPANSRIKISNPSLPSVPGDTNAPALEVPSMLLVQDWLTFWGLTSSGVTNLGICMDTHNEAIQFKKLADQRGWKRAILVTSALHMKRSPRCFQETRSRSNPGGLRFPSLWRSAQPRIQPLSGSRTLYHSRQLPPRENRLVGVSVAGVDIETEVRGQRSLSLVLGRERL